MSLSKKRYTSISGAYLSDSVKKSNFKHDICIYILSDLQWLLCEMEKYLEKSIVKKKTGFSNELHEIRSFEILI